MRVLIIDDDDFFQKFSSSQLKDRGFAVDVASNGEEGLAKAKETHPDVILLDIIMPKMDGFEVLTKLSQNVPLKSIPVIIFSSLGQEKDVTKAKSLGAVDHMNKNFFDLELLTNKINSVTKR